MHSSLLCYTITSLCSHHGACCSCAASNIACCCAALTGCFLAALRVCSMPRDIKQENILLAIQHAAPGVAQAASRDASAHGGRASSPTSSSAPCTHAAAAAGVGRMSLTGCGRDSSARGGMHGASRMVAKLADLGLHVVSLEEAWTWSYVSHVHEPWCICLLPCTLV